MVRGRRVRAVIASYPPNNTMDALDDCCSPKTKRKDQKTERKLQKEEVKNITTSITEFFQFDPPTTNCQSKFDTNGDSQNQTPQKQKLPTEVTTPHRIQLNVEDGNIAKTEEKEPENVVLPKKKLEKVQKSVTDFFPVRRSVRKTTKEVKEEKQKNLEKSLRLNLEDGLKVHYFEEKGRGVVTTKTFEKGEFVVEYSGDLISIPEAKKREILYAKDHTKGCYMYYFKHQNRQYCIDATPETGKLGRLVNHSKNGANLCTKVVALDGQPRLVLLAKEDIPENTEVLYDYGDRSREALLHHPWLAN